VLNIDSFKNFSEIHGSFKGININHEIDNKFPNTKLITLLNKIDIKSKTLVSDLDEFNPILISAKNKLNIDNLKDEIISYVNNLTSQEII